MLGVCAGVVTFNPEKDILLSNIKSIYHQVDKIIIVDNYSKNIDEILRLPFMYNKIHIIKNSNNYGIARALNQIFEWADKNEFNWVITFDQDSISPCNLIKEMMSITFEKNIGIICPRFTDKGDEVTRTNNKDYEDVDMCITSGSLMSVRAWKDSGRFDDWMFIDCVDYDICLKLRLHGFRIVRLNTVVLKHNVGNSAVLHILGIFRVKLYNHNSIRNYYFVRNYTYIIRKYWDIIKPYKRMRYIICWEFKKLVFEENKMDCIRSCIRGIIDGINVKIS